MSTMSGETGMDERRKTPRWLLSARVFFLWTSQDGTQRRGEGLARNLGTHGAYVEADSCPPVGTPVQMDIELPDLRFEGVRLHLASKGVVVRVVPCAENDICSHAFGISMRFGTKTDQDRLTDYAKDKVNH